VPKDLYLEGSVIAGIVDDIVTAVVPVLRELDPRVHVPNAETVHDSVAGRTLPEGLKSQVVFLEVIELNVWS